jgi:hypothetical protein
MGTFQLQSYQSLPCSHSWLQLTATSRNRSPQQTAPSSASYTALLSAQLTHFNMAYIKPSRAAVAQTVAGTAMLAAQAISSKTHRALLSLTRRRWMLLPGMNQQRQLFHLLPNALITHWPWHVGQQLSCLILRLQLLHLLLEAALLPQCRQQLSQQQVTQSTAAAAAAAV